MQKKIKGEKKIKKALIKLDADKYTEYKKKQKEDKISVIASMHGAALCRILKRVKGSLPKKETHKSVIVKTLCENTVKVIPKKQKLLTKCPKVEEQLPAGRKNALTDAMKVTIDEFLCRNDISYTLPGRNNQLYMDKVNGKSQYSPKQYLLWTCQELHSLLIKEAEMEGINFSSHYRYIKSKKEYI